MTATLHTIGYEKRTIEEFLELLRESEIDVLIDVRETAWSHKPGFSKTAFSAALDGIAGAGIDLGTDPEALLKQLIELKELAAKKDESVELTLEIDGRLLQAARRWRSTAARTAWTRLARR